MKAKAGLGDTVGDLVWNGEEEAGTGSRTYSVSGDMYWYFFFFWIRTVGPWKRVRQC